MMRWQHQHRDLFRRFAEVWEPAHPHGPVLSERDTDDPLAQLIADSSHNESREPSARLEAREPVYTSPGNTYGTGSTSGGDNTGSDGSGGSSSSSGSSPSSTCGSAKDCSSKSSPSTNTLPIVLGVIIPIVVAIIVFLIFIQKHRKRQRLEDMNDKHGSLDFGMGEVHRKGGKGGKRGIPEMTVTDMSSEKMLHGRGISVDLMGSPYVLAGEHAATKASFDSASRSIHDDADPYRPVRSASRSPARPAVHKTERTSDKQTLLSNAQTPSNSTPRSGSPVMEPPPPAYNGTNLSRKPIGPNDGSQAPTPPPPPPPPKSEDEKKAASNFSIPRNIDRSSISSKSSKTNPEGGRKSPPPPLPTQQPQIETADYSTDGPLPADGIENYSSYADMLGISGGPQDSEQPSFHQNEHADNSLAVPTYNDPRRLSASIRPLPPEDPTDNAEQRANRIRSFYKEYFDDSKPANDEQDDYYGYGDYYEDYDQEYLDGATIWDPETGQFITNGAPYGEPMTRRAMTPPPRGPPRFRPGPGGHRYTSSSGHSHGRGRAQSSASHRHPGARGRPVKKLPPPKPLNNLPTPHLLKDDMSSLPVMDFAPPMALKHRVAGRADSPSLEQRPYSPSVRAFTPLKSSYKELAVMPSPHALRKSGTFTGLDFAPPPKILDRGGGGSDTASVRSGRSGISAVNAYNVRAGNYRVSRIGNHDVGTKDDLATSLKPQWNIGR